MLRLKLGLIFGGFDAMHDMVLLLIYRVPAAAFGILLLLTIAIPALHSLMVIGRLLIGRPAQINWWVMGRVLPLVIAAIVAMPLILIMQGWTADWQIRIAEIALIYISVGVIFVPVMLPLLQAYAAGVPRFGALIYALLAILSLPVAGTLATHASVQVTRAIEVPSADPAHVRPAGFVIAPSVSGCARGILATVPEGIVTAVPSFDATLEAAYPAYFFFWADMSLKAAFLDFFEVFDCGVTNLRHNPDHFLVSSFVFLYRAFVSVIVLAVLALPFGRRSE